MKKIVVSLVIVVLCSGTARADIRNFWDPSQIHYAVKANDQERVKKLIKENPTCINSQQWNRGLTPLMMAAEAGNTDIALILLQAGADVNIRTMSKNTALHYAAYNRHAETFHLLLVWGANRNRLNCAHQSARMIAVDNGWQDILGQ